MVFLPISLQKSIQKRRSKLDKMSLVKNYDICLQDLEQQDAKTPEIQINDERPTSSHLKS